MQSNNDLILTDGDKKIIIELAMSPYQSFLSIARKYRLNTNITEEKIISIDDFSDSELEQILSNIDLYVSEEHNIRLSLGSFDEFWMVDYWTLKDAIKMKLGLISSN